MTTQFQPLDETWLDNFYSRTGKSAPQLIVDLGFSG